MSRDVLITGGVGFIGQAITGELRRQGFTVSAPATKLENRSAWREILEEKEWRSIIHLAAVSSFGDCEANPSLAEHTNVKSTEILAELALEICPKIQFVFSSTAQVYHNSDQPLTELSATAPQTVYSKTKLAAEIALKKIADRGLKTSVLRIFNHTHKTQRPIFFMPSVYQQLLEMRQTGIEILQVGNVDVSRDIGAVADLADALISIVTQQESLPGFDTFNICSGERRVLRDLILLMGEALQISFTIAVDPKRYRPNEPPSIVGSYKKLHNQTKWQPRYVTNKELIASFLSTFREK